MEEPKFTATRLFSRSDQIAFLSKSKGTQKCGSWGTRGEDYMLSILEVIVVVGTDCASVFRIGDWICKADLVRCCYLTASSTLTMCLVIECYLIEAATLH